MVAAMYATTCLAKRQANHSDPEVREQLNVWWQAVLQADGQQALQEEGTEAKPYVQLDNWIMPVRVAHEQSLRSCLTRPGVRLLLCYRAGDWNATLPLHSQSESRTLPRVAYNAMFFRIQRALVRRG